MYGDVCGLVTVGCTEMRREPQMILKRVIVTRTTVVAAGRMSMYATAQSVQRE
jgi:hypothetical protein